MEVRQGRLMTDKFPETEQEADEAARLLAEQMGSLSLEEQEQILFDVHGVDKSRDEDPPDIDGYIDKLEKEVLQTPGKADYERAKYFNEDYIDRKLLLAFLRTDRFDTKLAAQRLVKHFQIKAALFGSGEVLGRDVKLSDMTESDMATLESGYIQVLPRRDLAGRCVYFSATMHRPDDATVENINRTFWYMLTSNMKDEETQKKGMVGVSYNVGVRARADPLFVVKQVDQVLKGVPLKVMGAHYCFDDASLRPYVMGLHLFLDKELKSRFRPHFREDTQFVLQTYGIPTKDQPIHPNGDVSLAWHREWLRVRRVQEESDSTLDGTIVPRRFDVLFGRGKHTREHTGNLRAIHLVEIFQPQYERAGKQEKTMIADRIVTLVQESLGRFLKWEEEGWVEVTDEMAREKVSHFFRFLRGKNSINSTGKSPANCEGHAAKRVAPCSSTAPGSDSGETKQLRESDSS